MLIPRCWCSDPALAWEAHQQLNIFVGDNTNKWEVIFRYTLLYNANGNIRKQISIGTYRSNFVDNSDLWMTYIYDNSNRLLKADRDSGVTGNTHDLIDGYDKDGNFVGMKRYGSSNNLADDFGYSYFSGTNRLQTIGEGLTTYSYTYDNNGNMISDQLNRTGSIKYDHRNLMTEIRVMKTEANPDPFGTPNIDVLYLTQYRYDEAGNRISKFRYKYTGSTPDPIFEGDNPSWTLQSGEYYVRAVSGKEIALYSGSSLTQWNIWGLNNVGKINADTTRNYYLKDHLGSIRVVLNSTNTVISALDYDAWGNPLENRTYNVSTMEYDFTGKERDNETSYDYFGARYYDSRIGRWGQPEPLYNSNVQITAYGYCNSNPIVFTDILGLDEYYYTEGSLSPIRYPKAGDDVYYFEHSEGNFEVTEATGIYEELLGKTFYKAASASTARFFRDRQFGKYRETKNSDFIRYYSDYIDVNFTSTGINSVSKAVSNNDKMTLFLLAWLSKPKGPFDYKRNLNIGDLYFFGNLVYSQEEAGNILWGMTIAYYDVPLWEAKIGGNLYKLGNEGQLDEPNEVRAYERGYEFCQNHLFLGR